MSLKCKKIEKGIYETSYRGYHIKIENLNVTCPGPGRNIYGDWKLRAKNDETDDLIKCGHNTKTTCLENVKRAIDKKEV